MVYKPCRKAICKPTNVLPKKPITLYQGSTVPTKVLIFTANLQLP